MVTALNRDGNVARARRLMQEALSRFDLARFGETQTLGDCFDLLAADDLGVRFATLLDAMAGTELLLRHRLGGDR